MHFSDNRFYKQKDPGAVRFVQIESPLAGKTDAERRENVEYGTRCLRDSLMRGEAPFASHLLYPLCLDDQDPDERRAGMEAGFQVMAHTELTAVYIDRGISPGMAEGVIRARQLGHRVVYRSESMPGEDFEAPFSPSAVGPLFNTGD